MDAANRDVGRQGVPAVAAAGIRFVLHGKRFRVVPGSPRRVNEYLFEDRPLSSFQRLASTSQGDVLIFGHTHKPYTKRVDGVLFVMPARWASRRMATPAPAT
jgi:predicted phosphodiesterase